MSAFAVIETGGKQYKVAAGTKITIETLPNVKEGDSVVFDKVLLTSDGNELSVGKPYISGAKVTGTVEKTGKGEKVTVIKYKQKSRYFKKRGHRQPYLQVKIESI